MAKDSLGEKMDTIKFELNTDTDYRVVAEISLNGVSIDDYLIAFKAFLIACSFTEQTVEEIQMMENARYIIDREQQENNI